MKLSAFILSCNEERRIMTCLKGVAPYVDEIVVLEGGTDKTASIASGFGCRVYRLPQGERFGEYGNDNLGGGWHEPYRREIGLGLCRGDRVLIIDADELISAPVDFFRNCGTNLLFPRYNLTNSSTYISSWYPDYQLRFVPRDTKYDKSQIHCWAFVNEKSMSPYPIWHYKNVNVVKTDILKFKQVKPPFPEQHEEMIKCSTI